jgi:hypothetical protein
MFADEHLGVIEPLVHDGHDLSEQRPDCLGASLDQRVQQDLRRLAPVFVRIIHRPADHLERRPDDRL